VRGSDGQGEAFAMRIHGIDQLTPAELEHELAAGGRFVFFEYCISFVALTLRRPTDIYFLRADQYGWPRGLPYTVLSLLLGWWGIPWGLIYTPLTLFTNLSGGRDVTAEVRALLSLPAQGDAL
jgi:hypothetical protein